MPAKKKTSTKAKANTGHRLTDQQKKAIAAAGPEVTNASLAEQFGASPQTIANYRTTSPARGRRASTTTAATTPASGPVTAKGKNGSIIMDSEGDYIVIRVHRSRKNVVQGLVDQLLS